MPSAEKQVRVFISSTFRDMHAERDHLVKVVFPALREELEKHRVHLVDIDLRWGVTKEQADNDEALDVCLDQIDACRPFEMLNSFPVHRRAQRNRRLRASVRDLRTYSGKRQESRC